MENARVVLGMTLYNNAAHLREAADSILSQTHHDFALLMLDDGSSDEAEAIARAYERSDDRVRYWHHPQRRGMVPTWKEVVEIAVRECPHAEYFAWVSDHDRWAPEWLAEMLAVLDGNPAVVLAYPVCLRIDDGGVVVDKEPRSFRTVGVSSPIARWREFCHRGVGSGDMVYGLMRLRALREAGIFRPVLNPDRLLVGELTLQGQIEQVAKPLWFRRQAAVASIARQRATLFAGEVPPRFGWPPTWQHSAVLVDEYLRAPAPPVRVTALQMAGMLARYQLTSVWREYRKTDTSKSFGRGIDNLHYVKKLIKKGVLVSIHSTLIAFHRTRTIIRRSRRKAVYETLVAMHKFSARVRRTGRRARYELLVLTHRLGLRGSNSRNTP
jgi:hypothetical protein